MYMPNANITLEYQTQTIFDWLVLGIALGIIGLRWALLTHVGHYWHTWGVALGPQGFLAV